MAKANFFCIKKIKKVIAFLSLFSLVLILSIYYVISPFGENNNLIGNNTNVNVNINTENDEYFASLEVAKEEDYDRSKVDMSRCYRLVDQAYKLADRVVASR